MHEDADFLPHSEKQFAIIDSDEEITIAATGVQWGKSIAGAVWMKRMIHTFPDSGDNFLLAAPTYKIMNQSLLPYFLSVMGGMGEHLKSESVFTMPGKRNVYFRTETDPDSIVGIPNVKAGWLDEAGKLRLYFWENYQGRAAAKGAKTLLTTSPYSRNWLFQQFIKPSFKGPQPGVRLIRAASWENPYNHLSDLTRRREMRGKMDARRFDMLFGGEWGAMAGMVYDCWDEAQNLIKPFRLPDQTRYVAGIDWGFYPDPFVCVVRAITPDGRHFQVSEFYKTGLSPLDQVGYAQMAKQNWNIRTFYCDPSEPGMIEEFNRHGCSAIGADNDINRGIALHYELIQDRRYQLFEGTSPYTLDELESYHYPELEDLGPDDDAKEIKPVDQNNHCLDANRYVTISTYRQKQIPVARAALDITQMTSASRWRRLQQGRKSSGGTHTETWTEGGSDRDE